MLLRMSWANGSVAIFSHFSMNFIEATLERIAAKFRIFNEASRLPLATRSLIKAS
jgi:hypothetical protein